MKTVCILVILDGWGVGKHDESNPIYMGHLPVMNFIEANFPAGALQASGISVGLPWDEASGSEVGHLTIGAGKVMYQNHPKITLAIQDGSFFENKILKDAFRRARESGRAVHCMGLVSEGKAHAAAEHVDALMEMARRESVGKIFVHAVVDSRENEHGSGSEKLLEAMQKKIEQEKYGTLASVSGAYFAMPQDGSLEKTGAVLGVLLRPESPAESIAKLFQQAHAKNVADELTEPRVLPGAEPLVAGDTVIFWNFDGDGLKPLVERLTQRGAGSAIPENIEILTMSEYSDTLPVKVVFPKDTVIAPLGKVIADAGKNQMRIAESVRYQSITYYLNGMRDEPFTDEYRTDIPSKAMENPAEHPEMMAESITERVLLSLNERAFDFIAVNYANPDIIADTGDYEATKRAAETIDRELGRIVKVVLQENHTLIIVGSHSNAEKLLDLETGTATRHAKSNPVPFYVVGSAVRRSVPKIESKLEIVGFLSDVAPTVCALMGIKKPDAMTGQNLMEQLRYN